MDYKITAFKARWLEPNNNQFCEYCYFVKDKVVKAIDIDHIDGRGWKHNTDNRLNDPYNLILLCRDCHSHKTWKTKEYSRKIVKWIIDQRIYKRLMNFEPINKRWYMAEVV